MVWLTIGLAGLIALCAPTRVAAHDGPPYPIVSSERAGVYIVSIWTDPDATDDGSAGGHFWVMIERADERGRPPEGTRAAVSVRPLDREGTELTAQAVPVRGNAGNQFAAVLMDHEGRFAVHAAIDGPLGPATVDAEVHATYDLRPPPYMLAWYLAPFVLVGILWARLLLHRRRPALADMTRGSPAQLSRRR
jgi:hypothetical protein